MMMNKNKLETDNELNPVVPKNFTKTHSTYQRATNANKIKQIKRVMGMEEEKVEEFLNETVKNLCDIKFYQYDTR